MKIKIVGAKEHNLKNINLEIERNKFIVVTGLSGSGKSSLVFNTIFSEAQRDYLESLSTYARRSLPKINPSKVDYIDGLSPCIIIDQSSLAKNPRSTVGTVTEIYTFLRLLYSRLGTPILSSEEFSFNTPSGACKDCTGLGMEMTPDLDMLIDWEKALNEGAILHRTWAYGSRYWNIIKAVELFDMNKKLKDFSQDELNNLLYSEPIQYQNKNAGYIQSFSYEGIISRMKKRQGDSRGLEINSYDEKFFTSIPCRECGGSRLNEKARSVKINGKGIDDLVTMEVSDLAKYLLELRGQIADNILIFMEKILNNMISVGIGYLSLSRSVVTLSNGEAQKVKLARQLGSSLTELIYILDEPTSGLHAKDVDKICLVLKQLKEKPNTVIVVEHDKAVMFKADYIIDIGPAAGTNGGEVVAQGTPQEIMKSGTLTGNYLSMDNTCLKNKKRRTFLESIKLTSANIHNLKSINVDIPRNVLTCITGVSGSGKSSLIQVILKNNPEIIAVDQSPVGASPRSNPATYVGAFDLIRKEFANFTRKDASLFSFNSSGACPECRGLGYKLMDMHFLGDISQICEVCEGKRYKTEVLDLKYNQKSITDVLDMTIDEVNEFFKDHQIKKRISLLSDVGLGYLKLGQSLDTLSGGEAQRVKLASYLSKKGNVYVLDEPTRGLHFADIERLLGIFDKLVNLGNTVIVVEHNMEIIKNSDWIIDLGPDGGKNGGSIVAQGTPEEVAKVENSYTGMYLAKEL